MRRPFLLAASLLLSCGPAFAQLPQAGQQYAPQPNYVCAVAPNIVPYYTPSWIGAQAITANTTLKDGSPTLNTISAASATVTVTLCPAVNIVTVTSGHPFAFKAINVNNLITIAAGAGDTIDGSSTITLTSLNQSVILESDGTHTWRVVANSNGGSGGSGTVSSGTGGQMTYYASTGTTVSGNPNVTVSSGALTLGQSGIAGSIILNGSSSGTVTVQALANAGSTTFTLPGSNGSSGQFLQTDGSGNTSWQAGGSGSVNSGSSGQLTYYASTGTAVSGNANATISNGALTLGQSGVSGSIILNGSTSGSGTIQVAAIAGSSTFQIPSTNGSSGQYLQTNGSGITSWQTISSGTVNSGTSGQLTYYASTGTAVSGNANATISNGALTLGASTVAGSITLNGSSSGTGIIQVATAAGSGIVFQIPSATGSSGQFLQTNGAGVTSWQTAPGGGGGSGTVNSGTAGQITYYAGTGTVVSGDANATISSGALTLGQSGTAGSIILNGSSSGTVTLQTAAAAGSGIVFQFPTTNATSGSLLKTTGSGVTTWAANISESSGVVTVGNASTPTAGSIVLEGGTSGAVTIQVPAVAGTTTFQLPGSNGSSGQYLQTNGSGITSWQTISSGTVNSGTSGQLTYYASTGTAVSGNANATISNGALTLGASTVAGSITLNGSSSGTGIIQVAAAAGSGIVFQIPSSNGTSGQFLQTNGSGVTSWQSPTGSGTVNSATSGQLAYYASTGTAVGGNANVTISSGQLTLGQSGTAGSIVLNGSSSGTVTLGVPSAAGSTTFTLPSSNGSTGQFLQTNGSGVTSWQTPSGTGTVNSGTSGQITYYASTGTAVSGNANLTISSGILTVGQSGVSGAIVLNGSGSGTVTIQAASAAGSTTFQLPASNGSSGQFLQTNGSGVTSWQTASGSGTVNSGTSGQLAYYASTGTAVSGDANVTVNSGQLTLGQSGTAGSVILNGATSGTCTIGVPNVAGSGTTFTLPGSNGTAGQMLQTNGSGVTSWQTGIQSATVSLTAAQIISLESVPVQLVAAVSGAVIMPLAIQINFTASGTAFTSGGFVFAEYGNTVGASAAQATDAGLASATFKSGSAITLLSPSGGLNAGGTYVIAPQSPQNTGIFLTSTANFATGTGTATVTTFYMQY